MKRLLIIVPKDSVIDIYLTDSGFIYDQVERLFSTSCFKINLTDKMSLINLLITKFSLKDYSIQCYYDDFIFRVRS